MGIRSLYSRLQDLYAETDWPISSWKEVVVIFALDLPLLPLLLLMDGNFWLWFAVFMIWTSVTGVLFRLYRKRKTEKHTHRYE